MVLRSQAKLSPLLVSRKYGHALSSRRVTEHSQDSRNWLIVQPAKHGRYPPPRWACGDAQQGGTVGDVAK